MEFDDELKRTYLPEQHLFNNKILKYPLSSNALKILKIIIRQNLKEIKKINYAIKNVNQEIQDLKKIKPQDPNAYEIIDSLTKLNEDYAKDLNKKIKEFTQEIVYKLQMSNITFENYKKFYMILRIISTYKEDLFVHISLYKQINLLTGQLIEFLKSSLIYPQINSKTQFQLKQTLELTQKFNFCINYDELIQKLEIFK